MKTSRRRMYGMCVTSSLAMLIGIGTPICQAHQPDSLPTVVSSGVVPGNGDANDDGTVTPADAQYAYRILLGETSPTVSQFQKADTNFNGRIDGADVSAIFQGFLGKKALPAKQFLPGDVNADGQVTPADALDLYRYLYPSSGGDAHVTIMLYNADATQDGFVNYRDIRKIYDIFFGRS